MHDIEYSTLTSQFTMSFKGGSIDSYKIFLDHINMSRDDFFKWGLNSTIFPPISKVETEWKNLKQRIKNDDPVYIRGYGRDAKGTELYQNFYKLIFKNSHITKDSTNNSKPKKLIENLTGFERNKNISNYQVSHIWGHTKNLFLFEAPWNICYTPKIIDPFTGHETNGNWSKEYQSLFLKKAYDKYKQFIEDYNEIINSYNFKYELDKFASTLGSTYSDKQKKRFVKDALNELVPITCT